MATQVVPSNLREETSRIVEKLVSYPNLCIDTEFKSFKRVIPHETSEEQIYEDLKYNISYKNLREIGITICSNNGVVGGTWRFDIKPCKKAGIKRKKCISLEDFTCLLERIIEFKGLVKWVTFSGYFDMAHLLCLLTRLPLPDSIDAFVKLVGQRFGRVYDLKVVARGYNNFGDNRYLGLQKLADMIGVKRVGDEHDGASDSLVTAGVFAKFMNLNWISDTDEGFLYLLPKRIPYIIPSPIKNHSEQNTTAKEEERTLSTDAKKIELNHVSNSNQRPKKGQAAKKKSKEQRATQLNEAIVFPAALEHSTTLNCRPFNYHDGSVLSQQYSGHYGDAVSIPYASLQFQQSCLIG